MTLVCYRYWSGVATRRVIECHPNWDQIVADLLFVNHTTPALKLICSIKNVLIRFRSFFHTFKCHNVMFQFWQLLFTTTEMNKFQVIVVIDLGYSFNLLKNNYHSGRVSPDCNQTTIDCKSKEINSDQINWISICQRNIRQKLIRPDKKQNWQNTDHLLMKMNVPIDCYQFYAVFPNHWLANTRIDNPSFFKMYIFQRLWNSLDQI